MNFGPCKGDVSGFNLKSCFRSKGGSYRPAVAVSVRL